MSAPTLRPLLHDGVRAAYRIALPGAFRLNDERRRAPIGKGPSYRCFDETRSIFIHIPKTAGVSLCEALYGTPIISHARLRHYQVVYDWQTYESYFKFAFVRNPWDRLLPDSAAPGGIETAVQKSTTVAAG